MIKHNIKNYFKCLKYVFTPLGVITLGLVCGLSVALPGIINSVSDMCSEILNISGSVIDFEALFDNIILAVRLLDWSDPFAALGTMFTKQWFSATILDNINQIIGDIENYIAQISVAVNACISQIIAYAIVIVILIVLAIIAGFFLTKWMIRRDIAKRNIKKFIVSTLIGSVITAAYTVTTVWLYVIWSYSIYITVIVALLLTTLFSLTDSYFVHGYKKVEFKSVVNIKNAAKLILSDCIIFAIGITIALLITVITNIAVGVFVAIGLVTVTVCVMEMTAESYVKELADKAKRQNNETEQIAEQVNRAETAEAAATESNNED